MIHDKQWRMFKDCPADPLDAAAFLVYEYARSSKPALRWAEAMRNAQERERAGEVEASRDAYAKAKEIAKEAHEKACSSVSFWIADNQKGFIAECVRCQFFPTDAWLDLPANAREKRAKRFFDLEEWATMGGKFRMDEPPTKRNDPPLLMEPIRNMSVETLRCFDYALKLDWSLGNPRLIEQFKSWLENNEPPNREIVGGKGSTSARDLLKVLGALRLLETMSAEEAAEHTQQKLGEPLYSEASAWSRAKEKALCQLRLTFGE
jgi:hypothetical protein